MSPGVRSEVAQRVQAKVSAVIWFAVVVERVVGFLGRAEAYPWHGGGAGECK